MKQLILLFLAFSLTCCQQQQKQGVYTSITIDAFKEIYDTKSNIQVLDVRTPEEWEKGFIKGAIFDNFYDEKFAEKSAKTLDKKQPVYVYCRSGGRSVKASKTLLEKGFQNVINVEGGYLSWEKLEK